MIGSASTTQAIQSTNGPETVTRTTGDGYAAPGNPVNGSDSGPATKLFEDLAIQITPSDTDEVRDNHTFTATVFHNFGDGAGFVHEVAGVPVQLALTDSNGASSSPVCAPCNLTTDANGRVSQTFSSSTPGQTVGKASVTETLNGANLTRTTGDGYAAPGNPANGSDGPNATKTWVDAYIEINPPKGTNQLSATHTFTATVWVNDGLGGGYVHAPDGTRVMYAYVGSHVGTIKSTSPNPCTTLGGSCSVATTSTSAGHDQMQASTTVAVGSTTPNGPVALTRTTGSASPGHGNSANANKLWISTSVINESGGADITGQTVTGPVSVHDVFKAGSNAGGVQPTGHVSFMFFTNGTCTGTPASTEAGVNPAHPGIEADGTATSPTHSIAAAGDYCFKAQYTADPNYPDGFTDIEPFHVTITPSQPPVRDANIQITPPTAGNPVKTNHTLTAHVNVNTGGGFVNAPDGTTITFTLTNSGGATAVFVGPSSCSTTGGTGSCSVVISSPTAGTTTVSAATDVVVNGVSLHRVTDATATNSGPASKVWSNSVVSTDIINTSNAVVTTVQAGTTIRDFVRVARDPNTSPSVPNPTGTVVFHRYATIDCTGTPTNQSVALTPGNPSTATSDDFAPTANMSYQAEYLGDANYPARTGACEPLTVTPIPHPAIAIVKNPKSQTVAKGGTATFTITVTNTGDVTLTDVHVDDPLSPNCNRTKADIPALALDGAGRRGHLHLHAAERPVRLRQRRDRDRHASHGAGRDGHGHGAGQDRNAQAGTEAEAEAGRPKKKKPKMVSHKKPKVTG